MFLPDTNAMSERRDALHGEKLRDWFTQQVIPAFSWSILPADTAVAQVSARLHGPDPKPIRDRLIAGTALVHGMTVVTRNVADFERTGVSILNPWKD